MILEAAAILAIPVTSPEKLFSGPSAIRDEFYALAKRWHPDTSEEKRAHEVFAHITALHEAATAKSAIGHWEYPGRLSLKDIHTGKEFTFRYYKKHTFELGDLYIARTHVAFAVRREFDDLFDAAGRSFHFRYASPEMKKEVSRYLPQVDGKSPWVTQVITAESRFLVLEKTEELILLRDIVTHLGGKIDPRHVAWIMSSLLNIACYFQYAGLTHNDISLDTYFVSPVYHSGVLLGGWWYSAKQMSPLAALPVRSAKLAPPDVLASKMANRRLDLALIRDVGLTLLPPDAPEVMRKWLAYASDGNAVRDYTEWRAILGAAFGPRKYVEMNVAAADVYR